MSAQPTVPDPAALRPLSIGVLVVDDHAVVREGVARLVAHARFPLRLVRTAGTVAEALAAVFSMRPEVTILDADLDGEDGLAMIPQLSEFGGVLVLSSHGDAATRQRAHSLGARSFIEKHQPAAELLQSIAQIAEWRMRRDEPPAAAGSLSHAELAASSAVPAARRP